MADLERDDGELFTGGEHVSPSDERLDYRGTHHDNYVTMTARAQVARRPSR